MPAALAAADASATAATGGCTGCHEPPIQSRTKELRSISTEVESLQRDIQRDLDLVRQLPEDQLARVLEHSSRSSCARAEALVRRLGELREVAQMHARPLERLRTRMRQLRACIRPH